MPSKGDEGEFGGDGGARRGQFCGHGIVKNGAHFTSDEKGARARESAV